MVAISNTVGKELNSTGLRMKRTVIRINTEKVIETASEASSIHGGMGSRSTTSTQTTASARAMSPWRISAAMPPRPLGAAACSWVISLIRGAV
jgi:hypothetical protein